MKEANFLLYGVTFATPGGEGGQEGALWRRALEAGHAWEARTHLDPWLRRARGGAALRVRATPRSLSRHPLLLDLTNRYWIPALSQKERDALRRAPPGGRWTLQPAPILALPGTRGRRLNAGVRVAYTDHVTGRTTELPLRLGQVWQHFDVFESGSS